MSVLGPDIPDSINSNFAGLLDAAHSGWFLEDSDEFFRGFPIAADDDVLDVGCGGGVATLFSAKRGAGVIFSDTDPKAVAELEKKVLEQGSARSSQALVCDSDPLLVPDQCATRVVCMEVMEHVDDPQRVMSELVRAGKPGALYFLSVPGEQGEKIQRHFAPPSYFEKPNHIRIFSKDDFVGLVEESGLSIDAYAETGFFWVFWMSMHWAVEAAKGTSTGNEAVREKIEPPFDDSLDRWAALWTKIISTPEGLSFKHQMDKLLPKNQVIVARKPA